MSFIFDKHSKGPAESAEGATSAEPSSASLGPSPKSNLLGIKIAIAVSFVLSVFALGSTGLIYQSLNQEKREREVLETTQAEIQEKAAQFEDAVNEYQTMAFRMREQLEANVEEREQLMKEAERSRIEISNLQKRLQFVEEKTKAMDAEAVFVQSQSFAAPRVSAANAVPKKGPAVGTAASVETAKAKPAPVPSPVITTPQVLTVNSKFKFVVINIGLRDKVKIGDKLSVERNGKPIGIVQIEKLYENFSSGNILKESPDNPIQAKDTVRKSS